MFAVVLTTASGCVVNVGEAHPARLPDAVRTCVVTGLAATAPVVHEPRLTATHQVVITGGRVESSVPITDSPEEPRITWTALRVATVDDVVRWVPPEIRRTFSTGRSPGGEKVSAAVSTLGAHDGAFVGYAAIRPVQVDFTGTCADGDPTSGHLISWTDPEVGVVPCAAATGARTSAGARLARQEHCGKF
ncbi:hypothetical protein KRM28CT15_39280 [Krasilnikovia sp. M28-CT-15]